MELGRFFTAAEVQRRRNVVVLGQTPYQALFPVEDPIGKVVRIGLDQYQVIGVLAKRPSPGGLGIGVDDFAVIPETTYQKQFGLRAIDFGRGESRPIMIGAVPRRGRAARAGDARGRRDHAGAPQPAARPAG